VSGSTRVILSPIFSQETPIKGIYSITWVTKFRSIEWMTCPFKKMNSKTREQIKCWGFHTWFLVLENYKASRSYRDAFYTYFSIKSIFDFYFYRAFKPNASAVAFSSLLQFPHPLNLSRNRAVLHYRVALYYYPEQLQSVSLGVKDTLNSILFTR